LTIRPPYPQRLLDTDWIGGGVSARSGLDAVVAGGQLLLSELSHRKQDFFRVHLVTSAFNTISDVFVKFVYPCQTDRMRAAHCNEFWEVK